MTLASGAPPERYTGAVSAVADGGGVAGGSRPAHTTARSSIGSRWVPINERESLSAFHTSLHVADSRLLGQRCATMWQTAQIGLARASRPLQPVPARMPSANGAVYSQATLRAMQRLRTYGLRLSIIQQLERKHQSRQMF